MRHALAGHGASRGSALGRARVRLPHALEVAEEHIPASAVEDELARLHAAIDAVRAEMREMRDRLHGALVHEVGEFLDLHTLLLDDPELLQGLDDLVRRDLYGVDYALRLQRDRLAAVFRGMDDAYFRSRVEDIDHVVGRIHAMLHRRDADLRGGRGDPRSPTASPRPSSASCRRRRAGGGDRRRQRASHSAILAQPAPAAGGGRAAGCSRSTTATCWWSMAPPARSSSSPTPRPARYRARLREEKRERKQLCTACGASPRAPWTGWTSSCGRTPSRART